MKTFTSKRLQPLKLCCQQELRERIKASLAAQRERMVVPDPPPRYDEVFACGTRLLDDLGDANLAPETGQAT